MTSAKWQKFYIKKIIQFGAFSFSHARLFRECRNKKKWFKSYSMAQLISRLPSKRLHFFFRSASLLIHWTYGFCSLFCVVEMKRKTRQKCELYRHFSFALHTFFYWIKLLLVFSWSQHLSTDLANLRSDGIQFRRVSQSHILKCFDFALKISFKMLFKASSDSFWLEGLAWVYGFKKGTSKQLMQVGR